MVELICGEGYTWDWAAIGAVATAMATVVALFLGIYGPHLSQSLSDKRDLAAKRIEIRGFIDELSDVITNIWLKLDSKLETAGKTPEEAVTDEICSCGRLGGNATRVLADVRDRQSLFDDETARALIVAHQDLNRLDAVSEELLHLLEHHEITATEAEQRFERGRKPVLKSLCNLYRRLETYGAVHADWA